MILRFGKWTLHLSSNGGGMLGSQTLDSIDEHPWSHPYLTRANIARFRVYSEQVWDFAHRHSRARPAPLVCAFAGNMAQNMHKWARLAQAHGARATLFPNVMDTSALNMPEWEEFDGTHPDVLDGNAFLARFPGIALDVSCRRVPFGDSGMLRAANEFNAGERYQLLRLMSARPGLRHEVFLQYETFYPYFDWAAELSEFDVIYAAGTPFAAYASGRPYCVFSVGGDLQYDCGRADVLGKAMSVSFNAARFLLISNPHTLGHSRRLGLANGVYLPYPLDTERYCPGAGTTRREWEQQYGAGTFVLSSSRLDEAVKGHGEELFRTLVECARARPALKFLFLAYGSSADAFRRKIAHAGLGSQFILLDPAGKRRLIDYYRSCDIVMDHFVYGYYGATALEAAAAGKPVVMMLRREQYDPLYSGDVAPVSNAAAPGEIRDALLALVDNAPSRWGLGTAMREWVVRTHGQQKTGPLMLALLRLAADHVPLPQDLSNPLIDDETEGERAYHQACLRPVK